MRNRQIHNAIGIFLLQNWIKIQLKNFHATFAHGSSVLEPWKQNWCLEPCLLQDLFLSGSSEDEDQP